MLLPWVAVCLHSCDSCSVSYRYVDGRVLLVVHAGWSRWTLPHVDSIVCTDSWKLPLQNKTPTCEIFHYSLHECKFDLNLWLKSVEALSVLFCSTSVGPACFSSLGIFTSVSHWDSVEISPTLSENTCCFCIEVISLAIMFVCCVFPTCFRACQY